MTAGLVSVSFRGLSPSEVIRAAREAALTGIEWGADVHVPAGDVSAAKRVGGETRAAGLRVLAYGSYYKPGVSPAEEFDGVLASAAALRAPVIRVWAGNKGSASATAEAWRRTAEDAARIGRMAAREGCRVAFECHRNTLTDDYRAALRLMEAVREAGSACTGSLTRRETWPIIWRPLVPWLRIPRISTCFTGKGQTAIL